MIDSVSKMYTAVCALGVRLVDVEQHMREPTAPHFKIIGTGFVIDNDLIITNRHVLQAIKIEMENGGYEENSLMAQFLTKKEDGWSIHYLEVGHVGLCSTEDEDIGIAIIPSLPGYGDRKVNFGTPETLFPGHAIAILGYADGEKLQQANFGKIFQEHLYRFGPILQQGHVSAIAPIHGFGVVSRILLDIRTTGGLSGSPIFIPTTGQVIGIHFASNKSTTAFALPLDSKKIETYRNNFVSSLNSHAEFLRQSSAQK